jgi:hypothetical protein
MHLGARSGGVRGAWAGGVVVALVLGAACGNSGSSNGDFSPVGSSSGNSTSSGSSSGSSSSGGSSAASSSGSQASGSSSSSSSSSTQTGDDGGAGDDGGVVLESGAGDDATDDAESDDAGSSSGGSSSGGSGSSASSSGGGSSSSSSSGGGSSSSSGGATTYACVTTLSPAPVCNQAHDLCLCTRDAQCNSAGLDIAGVKGGCNSGHCNPQSDCTGAQAVDSAGCSIVGPFCNSNIANQACPANTTCEMDQAECGGQNQCCWCTSDTGCPVSHACVNDSSKHQCTGTCSGTGTSYDGMHCQLVSPGIPLCTAQ